MWAPAAWVAVNILFVPQFHVCGGVCQDGLKTVGGPFRTTQHGNIVSVLSPKNIYVRNCEVNKYDQPITLNHGTLSAIQVGSSNYCPSLFYRNARSYSWPSGIRIKGWVTLICR